MPWEDPSTAFGNAVPTVPVEILAKQAKAAAKIAEEKVCLETGCQPFPDLEVRMAD